jgi:spore germination cell wall hydrolase CwlJ-like protein
VSRALRFGAVAAAVTVIGAGATLSLLPAREAAGAAVMLPPAKAAALVQATSGQASLEMQAVGDQAKLINAALPFARGPLHSARPFEASGSDVDQRRALLCLTQAVYYEAGFEPADGRRAVAQVVLNRMRHPAFPKSVCGVV